MRPVKVEFQAFGPYAGYESVDFELLSGKGLFLVCGKTGIGKTMILDAMTFALFGKSSGHGRDDFEALRCTNADFDRATFVKFEFENNGRYYLFERRLERKRKNLSASCNVSRKGDNGVWQPLMENPREKAVNDKAAEIIGLDYEQFRRVYVLPQGQFERFLTSGSEEKEKILTSIFGEEKWQLIAERFYDEAGKRKNELKDIQEKIRNSLSEEGCDSIAELEQKVADNRDLEKNLDREFKKADYDSIIKEQREILSRVKRFGDLRKAGSRLAELEAKKEIRAGWEKTAEVARRAEKVRLLLETERKAADAFEKRKKDEELAGEKADAKKKASAEASENLRRHAEKETATEALKTRKIQYEEKRSEYEGLDGAERELENAKKAADAALKAENEARKKSDSFSEVILQLQNDYTALQGRHEELLNAYLAGITGELAEKLEAGMACPVCGSREHPNKAKPAENNVTRAEVDSVKKEADQKYSELQKKAAEQEKAKKLTEEKHAAFEKANTFAAALSERFNSKKKSLIPGIETLTELETETEKLRKEIEEYGNIKSRLTEAEKNAKDEYTRALAVVSSAGKEREAAGKALDEAKKAVKTGLKANGFESAGEAEGLMLSGEDLEELTSRMADYDADLKTAKENLAALNAELADLEEPDENKCREILDAADRAREEYIGKKSRLAGETERLQKKVTDLKAGGAGIEEKIREADEDFAFAKKLRGDSGTGLQRYVLGIMFSSVITAANRMLEMVHGGRYRLFRSDDKAQGSNKRGLELKVFDRNSGEHDGRFVNTLSGGEKFLVSLALSIGMSTVAQKSGIKIEALFIDEGFGSLDDESIGDAMNVLNDIQEANGLVGIISHVQLLQDQIPSKLRVEKDERGSHIVQTVG
ncbi:MAG: SMC family ATPase [Lachnospiraceae bacterium]|nr:SMC family ATPase [Lachnospiraceae bacterium]